MMQDSATKKGLMHVPQSLKETRAEIARKILETKSRPIKRDIFAIEVDGEFAGYVHVHGLNQKHYEHKGYIGYCLRPKFRGRGLAVNATKLLVKYAIKKHKLWRIEGTCRTFNEASAAVLKGAGFELEGILRKNKRKNGKFLDDMLWTYVK